MSILLKLFILVLIVILTALFTEFDAALTLADRHDFDENFDSSRKKEKLEKLDRDSDRPLPVYRFASLLFGSVAVVLSVLMFYSPASTALLNAGLSKAQIYLITAAYSIAVFMLIMAIGFLAPKRIALHRAQKVLMRYLTPLYALRIIFIPFTAIISGIASVPMRLCGIDPNSLEDDVTEEEIRMLVDAGEETGVLEESQREMINNIFEFDDITVGDVMNHRTEITAVDIEDGLNEAIRLSIEAGYSRIPVCNGGLDNIIGIVYVKDLLKYVGKKLPTSLSLKSVMRNAYHVPESKRCGELFKEMSERRVQMAVVIDEYGGTAGLVTFEDLLEAIVGNIQDEYDNEQEEIQQVDASTYTIDGVCGIDEVEQMLDVRLPQGDYDTLGGLILSMLGKIPEEDEKSSVECSGFRFTVEKLDERRIETVRAERLLPDDSKETDKVS